MQSTGVSIIILTKNGAHHLKTLLETFFKNNTHDPVELIVIDHGSTDNTADIVASYVNRAMIRLVQKLDRDNFAASCNFGAQKAHYPLLLFLNNDIVYTSDMLPRGVEILEDDTMGVVGCRLDNVPGKDPQKTRQKVQHTGIDFQWDEKKQFHRPIQIRHASLEAAAKVHGGVYPAVTGAFMLCRKADFQKIGGFCEEYDYGFEDIDFCLRVGRDLKKRCFCINGMGLQHLEGATRNQAEQEVRNKRFENNDGLFKKRMDKYIQKNKLYDFVVKSDTAVVMHVYYPELIPELFEKLKNLREYDLFVTTTEEVSTKINSIIQNYRKEYSIKVVKNIGNDILPFIDLIPELYDQRYKYICKLHTKRDHPDRDIGSSWRESLLDALLGSQSLVDKIFNVFKTTQSVQMIGPALMYLPMLGTIYDGLDKINSIRNAYLSKYKVEDWGFFGGTMFWIKMEALKKFWDTIPVKDIAFSASKSGVTMSWAHIFERLFGIIPFLTDGTVALVDYSIESKNYSEASIRVIEKNWIPPQIPTQFRTKTWRLFQSKLLIKYHLIYQAKLLNPYYYLSKKTELLDNKIDCIEHYLSTTEDNYLCEEHETNELHFSYNGYYLHYFNRGKQNKTTFTHKYLGETLTAFLSKKSNAYNPISDIKVSVLCITYNHEKYIERALQGFISQKTNFKYEIIIGDDCSTDRTVEIIEQYVNKFPDLFVFVKRKKNIGPRANSLDLRRRIRGQYVAFNEGDDYWINSLKLQLQVDYLDAHPECSVCFHPVFVIDEENSMDKTLFPIAQPGYKRSIHDIMERNFIQTNSVMYRWEFHKNEDSLLKTKTFLPGDWYNHILHAQYGEIHMLDNVMSVYRKHPGGIWSSEKDHLSLMKKWGNAHIQFFRCANEITSFKAHILFINKMKDMFVLLAKEYFTKMDIKNLYILINDNRDIAPICFNYLKWNLDLQKINDAESLATELKKIFTISTIVTSYNHEMFIEQCIQSVCSQDGFFTHKVIIADDFSNDGTTKVIEKYKRKYPKLIYVMPSSKNLGMLKNMKRSFEACNSEFVAICEGDDYWLPYKLHKQLSFLLQNFDFEMCFNWLLLLDESTQKLYPHYQQTSIINQKITFEQLLPMDLIANFSCCFYRKNAIDKIPESYYQEKNAADWLFNLCIAGSSDIGFLKEFLSVYRLNEKGQWSGLTKNEQHQRLIHSYNTFTKYFKDKKNIIAKYKPTLPFYSDLNDNFFIKEDEKIQNNLKIKCVIDSLKITHGVLCVKGWILHLDYTMDSYVCKYLFFLCAKTNKVHQLTLLQNENREDVANVFGIDSNVNVQKKYSYGFSGLIIPEGIPDGIHKLVLGVCMHDSKFYFVTKKQVEVLNNQFSICV